MIREVRLAPDPLALARALSGRPGLAVLASDPRGALSPADARFSFVACEPTGESSDLVPAAGAPSRGWAGHAAAPRWIGAIPYEHFRGLERRGYARPDERESPMISATKWLHYAAMLRVDHATGVVAIEADDEASAERLYDAVRSGPRAAAPSARASAAHAAAPPSDRAHAEIVRRALDYIRAGDIYQVNLARRLTFTLRGAPLELFSSMFRHAPCPYGVYLDMGEVQVACTSPELALEVRGRRVRTAPIKGTRPRGEDWTTDAALRDDLERDPKERAELVMAIDLHRNDLGRFANPGSVRVLGEPAIRSGLTVHSRVAQVVCERDLGVELSTIARACLPCGSVTGAPKVRAMEIIAELEPCRRGLYTGALGYVGRDGSLVLTMAIRTATMRAGVVHYFSGGGIVWGSDPEREVRETEWKALQIAQKLGRSGPRALADEDGR